MGLEVLTSEKRERLERLMKQGLGKLSLVQQRSVKMTFELFRGDPVTAIARRIGVSKSTVSMLRRRLIAEGFESFLRKWEASVQRAAPKEKRKRGPKGIESLDDFLARSYDAEEPVFELGWLFISATVNIAIFAVSDGKTSTGGQRRGAQSLVEKAISILRRTDVEKLHWSQLSVLDFDLDRILNGLAEGLNRLQATPADSRPRNMLNPFPFLFEAFESEFKFLCITQGAREDCQQWLSELSNDRSQRVVTISQDMLPSGFLSWFGTSIYRLRMRWSCPGLLPLHWKIRNEVETWRASSSADHFLYRCEVSDFEIARRHTALWRYPACLHALFQMNRQMWSQLPWRTEFPLKVSRRRLRIDVERTDTISTSYDVNVGLIPDLSITIDLRPPTGAEMDSAQLAGLTRKQWRAKNGAVRLYYSINAQSFRELERSVIPEIDQGTPEGFDRINCTLFPRHFVATEDSVSLEASRCFAEGRPAGCFQEDVIIAGETTPSLVFYAPDLVLGIRRAYRMNIYGDAIFKMEASLADGVQGMQSLPQASFKINGISKLNRYRPSYWRLRPLGSGDPESDGRWSVLVIRQDNAFRAGQPFPFATQPTETEGFNILLRDLDADLLFLALPEEDRSQAETMVKRWSAMIHSLLAPLYDFQTDIGRRQILSAVDPDLRGQAARHPNLQDWVNQTLDEFIAGSRILRKAIEIAQRCSLCGLPPIPCFIESKTSLVYRWRRYLRLSLRGRIVQKKKDQQLISEITPDLIEQDETTDRDDLTALIRRLFSETVSSDLAEHFKEYCEDGFEKVWEEALDRLGTEVNKASQNVLLEARAIARGDEDKNNLTDVVNCLKKLRQFRQAE